MSRLPVDHWESGTAGRTSTAGEASERSRTATSVCGFCSTGCGLELPVNTHDDLLVPALHYPVNRGMACCKGWEALRVLDTPQRATTPLLRSPQGTMRRIPWEAAIDTFCTRLKEIQQRHGADSVAFLSTGQIATEEMIFLGALARFGMGIVHGDGNTRQCMATAATAYKESFGFDAPPYTYVDLESSDVIVLVGSNLCIAHPILWQHVRRNPHRPEIIVIDPRCTETASAATKHVALRPKSDLVLFYGLAHLLIRNGWVASEYIDKHTRGYEPFARHVARFTPQKVSDQTGISVDELEQLARTIHLGRRVSFWWTMGVNQSFQGVRTAQAIINLALMTGNIGRPGTGANSITGQCNAMGSRLYSNTTCLFGGRDFANAEHRREVAAILGIDERRISAQESQPYHQILENVLRGRIRALWIIGTNPAHSWINQHQFRDIAGRLDWLIVQDMYYPTETAALADLFLPAAGWGEKEGTLINSERRIGRMRRVKTPPGDALSDFAIFQRIAQAWGCGELFNGWDSPRSVFRLLVELSRGRPCDVTGIADYDTLDACGGVQWPATERPQGEHHRRLFEDGVFFHADGRARFIFDDPQEMPERPGKRFPYLLLTGRGSAAQWHTQTRTAHSHVLRQLAPRRIYVEIHPRDARRERIAPHDDVIVESPRGSLRARAFVTPTVPAGTVFLPMHYAETNRLTHAHFDPHSHQPSYKDCAVRVRRIEPWDNT